MGLPLTTHSREEILEVAEEVQGGPVGQAAPMIFCDAEGTCFFDDAPNPYVAAITEILNRKGQDGWELVQIAFREQQLICIWRRPR
ncbi:MAG: hypothetical protein H5T59_12175 [Anaerolineae bacterium]|nr:hypothetical protein [Anaerolineae bacterium]